MMEKVKELLGQFKSCFDLCQPCHSAPTPDGNSITVQCVSIGIEIHVDS